MNQKHQVLRDVLLMRDEEVWMVLHPSLGLLGETPDRGDCLVLTSQRLLGFGKEQSRNKQILLPLETVNGVELNSTVRSLKPLMQGGLLLLAAMVVVWLALAFNALGVLSWLIVATMVLLAGVTASTFFASEQTAVITFRAGTSEVTLPLHTPQAQEAARTLALRFFQAKTGQERGVSGVPSTVTSAPWPGTPEHDPLEAAQRGDADNPDATAHSVESTQAERRRDI